MLKDIEVVSNLLATVSRAALTPVEQAPIEYDVEPFGCMPSSNMAGTYDRFIL